MIDRDLARLYSVETRMLNQAVRRNIERFPDDFMFQITKDELNSLRSQIVILKRRGRHPKYLPLVFTEQGVAMLSSVLNSERAIQVNIAIMRTFTKLRDMLMRYSELKKEIENMDRKYSQRFKIADERFKIIFEVIKRLTIEEERPKREMGFVLPKPMKRNK